MRKFFTNPIFNPKHLSICMGLMAFLFLGSAVKAQNTNIAPIATTSGNGSGSVTPYLYNWGTINDLSYGTCGSQTAFIWTTDPPNGTEYMEWEWNQQYPINKIVIYHAQTTGRFLTGGTIQYWDGSTWVNHYTFSGLPQVCDNTISFPLFVSNKMRIANWVAGTGQTSNMNYREIEIYQGARPGTHASVFETFMKGKNCGATSDSISVNVRNIGLSKLQNFWVGTKVTGTANGSPVTINDSVLYTDSLITGKSVIVNVGKVNTINGATLTVKSWVRAANDSDKTDDSLSGYRTVLGSPTANPSPSNNNRCGSGSVTLAGGAVSGNTVFWYDKAAGGTLLGIGNTFKSPYIAAPITATYYAAGAKISGDSTMKAGFGGAKFSGPGYETGNMFDVNIKKALSIDSFAIHLASTGKRTVSLYMKTGSYNTFATTPSAWVLVETKEVQGKGLGNASSFVLTKPLEFSEGTYSFYMYADQNLAYEGISNPADKILTTTALEASFGIALQDKFTNPIAPTAPAVALKWNGNIYYHESCVSNSRTPVTATAKPLPVGSNLVKGPNFVGKYDAGTLTQPDIVANPDALEYEIVPPTGFLNSGFGASGTWDISLVQLKTINGTTVPSGDVTYTKPTSSSNGTIKYKPSANYTDSTIILTVNLIRRDNNCDSTLQRYIFDAPRPKAGFNATSPCDGNYVDFTNTSSILSGSITFSWDFADGAGSTLADPSHLYGAHGTYNVILKAISNFGYVDSSVKTITVKQLPVPNFDFSNACEGAAITLIDNSAIPAGTSTYTWVYGDGSANGNGKTSSKLYAQPGIYPVSLIVDVNGCADKVTKYVTQAPRGVASFTVDLGSCDNKSINFKSTSTQPEFGGYSLTYNFGDMNEASGANVSHTYSSFNSYTATLYATTDLGCIDTASMVVSLRESPKPAFTTVGGNCTNQDILFSNASGVPAGYTNAYSWEFGDAFTSLDDNPSHSYPASGAYNVTLTAISSNLCQNTTTTTIIIGEKPNADFVVNKVCLGNPTQFLNNSTISAGTLTYNWDLGNGNKSTDVNPTETYTNAGTYNASLVAVSSSGCTDTSSISVEVAAIPTVDIAAASAQWGEGTMKFTTNTTGVSYRWYFGDGGQSSDQNPSYQYQFAGNWHVTLEVISPDGCKNSISTDVFVNPLSASKANGSTMAVYPNPTSGIFYINYTGSQQIATITVADMLGRQVANFVPEFYGNEMVLDMTKHTAGIYFVTTTDVLGKAQTNKITITK
jgi:PKD repeat protein